MLLSNMTQFNQMTELWIFVASPNDSEPPKSPSYLKEYNICIPEKTDEVETYDPKDANNSNQAFKWEKYVTTHDQMLSACISEETPHEREVCGVLV